MLSIAHGLTGAYLASLFPDQPLIYIPAAIGMHFLEDAVPHWDFGTGLSSGKKSLFAAYGLEVFDLIVTFLLIYLIWQQPLSPFLSNPHSLWQAINWPIWIGAFAGILIDLLEIPASFFQLKNIPLLKQIHYFHEKIHVSTSRVFFGLLPQFLVVISIISLTIWGI